jgi:hypothetical protein
MRLRIAFTQGGESQKRCEDAHALQKLRETKHAPLLKSALEFCSRSYI